MFMIENDACILYWKTPVPSFVSFAVDCVWMNWYYRVDSLQLALFRFRVDAWNITKLNARSCRLQSFESKYIEENMRQEHVTAIQARIRCVSPVEVTPKNRPTRAENETQGLQTVEQAKSKQADAHTINTILMKKSCICKCVCVTNTV